MDRRNLMVGVGGSVAGLLGLTAEAKGDVIRTPGTKGFLVFTQEVGCLPPYKAQAFIERIKDKLIPKRPDGWQIIVRPTREYGMGKVEVFVVDEKADLKAVERFIFDNKTNKLSDVDHTEEYSEQKLQQIRDYVQLMLGAPVVRMCNEMVPMIDHFIERGRKYNVNNLQQFVYESVKETTTHYTWENGEQYMVCRLEGVDFEEDE